MGRVVQTGEAWGPVLGGRGALGRLLNTPAPPRVPLAGWHLIFPRQEHFHLSCYLSPFSALGVCYIFAESHDHPPQPRCASAAPAAALPLGAAAPVSAGELSQGCCREEWTVRARRTQAYTPMAAQPHIYLQAQLHRWWGTPGVSPIPGQEEGGEHAKLGAGLHEARAQPRLGLMGYTRRQGQAGVC